MQALGYYISLPFLYLISLLPFPLMYRLSDLLFLILFHLSGYRKKVVYKNLQQAYPDKDAAWIEQTARQFYRYLCDLILETLKLSSVSGKGLKQHIRFSNPQLFRQLQEEHHAGVIVVMGHQGNWEWASSATPLHTGQLLLGIYKPLSNPYFERFFLRMRSRFGTRLVPMQDSFRQMLQHKDQFAVTAFIADQTPSRSDKMYWTQFMRQDTPVFMGTELLARRFNYPVVFAWMQREKRGQYLIHLELLCREPGTLKDFELTQIHTRRLEEVIDSDPAIWLWSHRRWKHQRPENGV